MKKHTLTYTDPDGLEFKVEYPDVKETHQLEIINDMIKGAAVAMGYHPDTVNDFFPADSTIDFAKP
jgi:hypothetical protein